MTARIPSRWPLRIAPWQFLLTDPRRVLECEQRLEPPRAYEVADVETRATTIGDLAADVHAFLVQSMGAAAPAYVQLLRATPKGIGTEYAVLPPEASVESMDLFNLASRNMHDGATKKHDGATEQLVVCSLLPACLPLQPGAPPRRKPLPLIRNPPRGPAWPSPPNTMPPPAETPLVQAPPLLCEEVTDEPPVAPPEPQPAPDGVPVPADILDALQRLRVVARDGAGNTRPLAPDHNPMLRALCNASIDHAPSTHLPTERGKYQQLGAHLERIEEQPTCVRSARACACT